MRNHKDILRTGFIILLALSIILSIGITSQVSPGYAQQPFQTLPPAQATFLTPIGPSTPIPTPLPTVGPGQVFSNDDPNRPEISLLYGDEQFGYGEIFGSDDLYLMWVTDEDGTHYLVVDTNNEVLFGEEDKRTGDIREDESFKKFLLDRDTLIDQLDEIIIEVKERERSRDGFFEAGLVVGGGGLIVCIIATQGVCALAAKVLVPGALTFLGIGIGYAVGLPSAVERRNDKNKEIDLMEDTLLGRFSIAMSKLSNP